MPHDYEEHIPISSKMQRKRYCIAESVLGILSSMVNIPYTWHLTHNTYSDILYGAIISIPACFTQAMIGLYTHS